MSDVLFAIEGRLGRITLNRPKALNALTHEMVRTMDAALAAWAVDDAIALVSIEGAGERGLCAGGDIRGLYAAVKAGDFSAAAAFFRDEYRLNARIAAYPKPYVAFMDGIVMGGGVGVSAHGSHRLVTERSRIAMPEVGIGLLPDVGGTWLLAQAPDGLGTHAALTGGTLGAADVIACGLADLCLPSAQWPDLAAELRRCGSPAEIDACLRPRMVTPPDGVLAGARSWIAACYGATTVEDILGRLAAHGEPAARAAAAEIAGKCPAALKVTLRAVREAPSLGGLPACLRQEYRLVMGCIARRDFAEGVRAAVVDKDRTPAWSPARLADVSDAMIDGIFDGPDHGGLGTLH